MEKEKLEKEYRKYLLELELMELDDFHFYYDVEFNCALDRLDQAMCFFVYFQKQITKQIRIQKVLNKLSGGFLVAFENPFWKKVTTTELDRLDQIMRTLQPLYYHIRTFSEEYLTFENTSPIIGLTKFITQFTCEEAQFYEAKSKEADLLTKGIGCNMNVPDPLFFLPFFEEKIGNLVGTKETDTKKEQVGKCLEKK